MKRYLIIAMLLLIISASSMAAKDNNQGKGQEKDKGTLQASGDGGPAYTINIKDDSFQPPTLVVPVGSTVTWHNQDGKDHVVRSEGKFDSGVINAGKKFSFYFSTPGTYKYHSLNTDIKGEITVTATAAPETPSPVGKPSTTTSISQPSTTPSVSQVQTTQVTVQQGTYPQVSQEISPNYILQYSQYYAMPSAVAPSTHIIAPQKYSIQNIPSTLYFGYQKQAIPYAQYQNYATLTGGNSLWILGDTSWTQYAAVPLGASLSLIATSAQAGDGYLYEINPDGTLQKNSYYFYQGYNQIGFWAQSVGQHILLFAKDGQVSNSIIIDVVEYYLYPGTGSTPTYLPTPIVTSGDTPATIVSQGMRGYQVFLDGRYIGTEGIGGDALDGRFSFKVVGNQNHDIRVYDGQFNYPKTIFFPRGVQKLIYVEPGTSVYI